MSVFNYEHKISYYPVPKCACTSLKSLFFEIENKFAFKNFSVNGKQKYIHDFFISSSFVNSRNNDVDDHLRFAVLRDPVERLLSCYSNRVVAYKELSSKHLPPEAQDAGLKADPSLSDFIANLEGYRKFSNSIAHHTESLVFFLGDDPSWFAYLYTLNNLSELIEKLEDITKMRLTLGREQTAGPKLSRNDLTMQEIRVIQNFYAKDYDVYAPAFA